LALLTNYSTRDLQYLGTLQGPFPLRDPAYFTDCMTKTDPDEVLACLGKPVEEKCKS
jgi:hypothetical protein